LGPHFYLIGLDDLEDVVVLGLQLRVFEGVVMALGVFVLHFSLQAHILGEELILSSLGC
jgi:hypothetical protein